MRRLILMRHAEAEASSARGDIGRGLTARGVEEAQAVGKALFERGARPDLALVSSAERAHQTWEAASAWFGDAEVELGPEIYNASAEVLRDAVAAAADRAATLMVIGHNPGVHQFAAELMMEQAASPASPDRITGGFPPGAAVIYAIDENGRPTYECFINPDDLP